MVVSVSPRLEDNLDTDDEPEATYSDPRFALGFHSMSLAAGYSDHERFYDGRTFAGTPDPTISRRKRRQRESEGLVESATLFDYKTLADGDAFRLAVLQPGTGRSPIECSLVWEDSKNPRRHYRCLSYAWESINRDAAILLDGCKFPVTQNLLRALQSLRKRRSTLLIWIDQICINQNDDRERGHQVSIMKNIFNQAHKVYIWLGEASHRSDKLCEYAKKMRRGDDSPKSVLSRILSHREMKYAIQKLLERPWFSRVWVIPEAALSRHTSVVCGTSHITWENLVRLVRDVQLPVAPGFDKQVSLMGNPRQRIAIITQMIASQKEALAHTDITQLLIIGKSSKATDVRDMVYAFYGLTYLSTFPDYSRAPERLYIDIIHMYISAILWEASYEKVHSLSEEQKAFQLMSILYSAGALHQHYSSLPSWIPDWTFSWHLAPMWAKPTPNFSVSGEDSWCLNIRSDFRAGGDKIEDFEVKVENQLRISAYVFDTILLVNDVTPASTPGTSQTFAKSPVEGDGSLLTDLPTLRYGRHFFKTDKGHVGLATPGINVGDEVAIILGGDVPVIIRRFPEYDRKYRAYQLLCECYVQSPAVMHGDLLRENWTLAEDIVFI